MRTYPSEEALVAAYWRRLVRSIDPARAGKRGKPLSKTYSAVRQYFAASRNAPRRRSGSHQGRKINPSIAG
jgi:hypothetical protein